MIAEAAARAGVAVVPRGTYAAVQGPRLESAAEIDRLERDGAHLVGMTGMPEAALAREQQIPYAALAVVANPAAGRGASAQAVSLEEIGSVLREAMERVRLVLGKVAEQPWPSVRSCAWGTRCFARWRGPWRASARRSSRGSWRT